jgi:hypothetical protein
MIMGRGSEEISNGKTRFGAHNIGPAALIFVMSGAGGPCLSRMLTFEDIKPGARLRGLDSADTVEVVQVAHFGPDAFNLVFRVDGRVGERLVYRGKRFSTFRNRTELRMSVANSNAPQSESELQVTK